MKRLLSLFLLVMVFIFISSGAWAAPGDSANDPIIIATAAQLDAVRSGLNKYYKLSNDINLTMYLAPGGAGEAKWGASGWEPIGSYATRFTGGFDGAGHAITGLWISRDIDEVGVFSFIIADISNLGIEINDDKGGVKGDHDVGGLAGYTHNSNITNCYVTGNVCGNIGVGGLVGYHNGSITNCYATGNISGYQVVGGLVGIQSDSSIAICYATGNVSGASGSVGGLVGVQLNGSVTNCYATGNVSSSVSSSNFYAGGLVAYQARGNIVNCYATGNVSGYQVVGSLVGYQIHNDSITSCYATGNVSGIYDVGGMVGFQPNVDNTITNSYRYEFSTLNGTVIPPSSNDINDVHGGIKTAAEFMTKSTYSNNSWLFNDSTTAAGPWYWDTRGFPKLNMGTENFPFPWEPIVPTIPVITINAQPQSITVMAGSISGSLSVSASLTLNGTLNYQWYSNTTNSNTGGSLISGETKASFSIPTDLTVGEYYYYCIVSATGAESLNSTAVMVTVLNTPISVITINAEPRSTNVTAGGISGNISVSASVTPSSVLNYQWYSNTTNSNTGGVLISGATSSIFSIPTDLRAGTYYYYCVVSATGATSVFSNVSIVTVATGGSSNSGGGCNAVNYVYFTIILLGFIPFIRNRV